MSVAIVGLDGAGKTTVARHLVDRLPFETVYVYMGMNPASANISLPTTRLVQAHKRRVAGAAAGAPSSLHAISERRRQRGTVWSTLRLVNRLAEEAVRHAVSCFQQLRGRLVVTDRDFLVDYAAAAKEPVSALDRIHLWFLRAVLPRPDLLVWLDAPPAVLYDRKPEVPIPYLERRRCRIAELRSGLGRMEVLDAEQSEDEVYLGVERLVLALCERRRIRARRAVSER